MIIYMKHPKHGTKVAISEQEAVFDETNGWTRFNIPSVGSAPVVVPDEVEEPSIASSVEVDTNGNTREELTKQYFDKFGSKPHWKMSLESIKDKLCQQPSI